MPRPKKKNPGDMTPSRPGNDGREKDEAGNVKPAKAAVPVVTTTKSGFKKERF